jgi:cell wall-associated NlpC family hydrolase
MIGCQAPRGGADPSGFDCSGLTQYVWARFGVRMPHYTVSQFRDFPRVPPGEEAPGDLVFFRGTHGEPPAHEGLYLGEGSFIHAPHTGAVVQVAGSHQRAHARHSQQVGGSDKLDERPRDGIRPRSAGGTVASNNTRHEGAALSIHGEAI